MTRKQTVDIPDGLEVVGVTYAPIGGFTPPPPANVVRYNAIDKGTAYQNGCTVVGWVDFELSEAIDTSKPFTAYLTEENAVAFDIEITEADGTITDLIWERLDGQENSGLIVDFWHKGELRATESGLWMSIPGVSKQGRFAYQIAGSVLTHTIVGFGDEEGMTDYVKDSCYLDPDTTDDDVTPTQKWARNDQYPRNEGMQVATRFVVEVG